MTPAHERVEPEHVNHARRVADAVLYEGYLLYPYRASARKNQSRFQFGVLMPPAYGAIDDSEATSCQTECLLECGDEARVEIGLRFLRLQRRAVYGAGPSMPSAPGSGEMREVSSLLVDGTEFTSWDEAREEEQVFSADVASLAGAGTEQAFRLPGGEAAEDLRDAAGRLAGRLVRRWSPAEGVIRVHAERAAGPYQALKLRVRVENHTPADAPPRGRNDGLRHALIAAHTLIGVAGGTFLSMTDPPEWAATEVAACVNTGTWPVLAGPAECRNLMLSSPVILYDHPEIAPESAGDLFDATEIDEILTLRTLALTDAEKREARSTDPRAAGIIDRLDDLPPEMLERMHGAIRYLAPSQDRTPAPPGDVPAWSEPGPQDPRIPRDPAAGPSAASPAAGPAGPTAGTPWDPAAAPASAPWWDPGADSSVSPETDHAIVSGVPVARGSRVMMRPGSRRADAQDMFLAGREAVVEAVLHDVDGTVHVAVSPVADPAAELQRGHGRFLYFAPDELEPAGGDPSRAGDEPGVHDNPHGQMREETT